MLSVKCILALNDAGMIPHAEIFSGVRECIGHIKIRNGRVLDRSILFARPFHADRACRDDDIPAFDFLLHSPAGPDPDKSLRPAADEFLHGDRSGWSSDSRRCHTDRSSVKGARVRDILSVIRHKDGIFKISRDLAAPLRIARQENIFTDFPRRDLNVILPALILRIINHCHRPFPFIIRMHNTFPDPHPQFMKIANILYYFLHMFCVKTTIIKRNIVHKTLLCIFPCF